MSAPEHTIDTLGAAVTAALDDEYTLVYTEQGQDLPAGVVAALVTGEEPWQTADGEELVEWADRTRWGTACENVDELAKDIVRRWESENTPDTDADSDDLESLLEDEWPASDQRDSAIEHVMQRDRSGWFDELVAGHGPVLLRVTIESMNEDAGLSFTPITPAAFLDLLGFEHTDHNLKLAGEVIDNASPEYTVAIGQALIGVDLETLVNLPDDGKVELRNPHVWLGSPFAGSGWCSEDPFTGTLIVDRGDLRTDKDAFGWSWDEVVGGTSPKFFAGEIAAVPAKGNQP